MNIGGSIRSYCYACALGRINRLKSAVFLQPARIYCYAARLDSQKLNANVLHKLPAPEFVKFYQNRSFAFLILRNYSASTTPDGQIPGARTTGYNSKGKIPKPVIEVRGGKGYSDFGHNEKQRLARVGLEPLKNAATYLVLFLIFIGFFNWDA